jgi:hypothetical protein
VVAVVVLQASEEHCDSTHFGAAHAKHAKRAQGLLLLAAIWGCAAHLAGEMMGAQPRRSLAGRAWRRWLSHRLRPQTLVRTGSAAGAASIGMHAPASAPSSSDAPARSGDVSDVGLRKEGQELNS